MTTPDSRYLCSQAENISVSALLAPIFAYHSSVCCSISYCRENDSFAKKSISHLLKEHTECFEGDMQIICSQKRNLKVSKQREENAY